MERKRLAKIAGHIMGKVTSTELAILGAKVPGGAFNVDLVVAHLAVDDGEAQRQIDHHMADAGGEQRFGRPSS